MKVKELKEILQKFDDNASVYFGLSGHIPFEKIEKDEYDEFKAEVELELLPLKAERVNDDDLLMRFESRE